MLGHTSEEIQGRMDIDFVPQEEADLFLERDRFVLETGQEDITEEPFTDTQGHPHVLVTKKGLFVDTAGQRFIVGVIRDVTESKSKEVQLRNSLLEKEVLLKEVHHRVKNNLQIISSLLFLQKDGIADPAIQELFDESRNRIASMALVHENCTGPGIWAGSIDGVSGAVGPRVIQTLRGNKTPDSFTILPPATCLWNKAIPWDGLNELLTNAIKHGFEGRKTGEIRLAVAVSDAFVRAEVADDGVALPEGFHPDACKTLGMQLVVQLTRQLRGALTFGSGQGTVFRLSFPLADAAKAEQPHP
jgi:PAS domain S-box-containing protein